MHKLIIHTQEPVNCRESSLHRIYRTQPITQPQKQSQKIVMKLKASLYLYKENINSISSQQKKTMKSKSRIVMFFNPLSQIITAIQDGIQEIQNLDIITLMFNGKQIQSIRCYVVVFKSYVIAQDFNKYLGLISNDFYYLYLEDFCIISGSLHQQMETEHTQHKIKQISNINNDYTRLPICPKCIKLVDSQLSGIYIPQSQQQMQNQQICEVNCQVCHKIKNKSPNISCQSCHKSEDIWVCLICGTFGCGRYKNADAQKHYKLTQHPLSYDLSTGCIWNYHNDCFSHQIKGKDPQYIIQPEEKLDNNTQVENTFWKYCAIISEQLQQQRAYYNEILKEQQDKFYVSLKQLDIRLEQLSEIKTEQIGTLKKKQKRLAKVDKRNKQLKQQCQEERIILSQRQRSTKMQYQRPEALINKKKKQIEDIQNQIAEILLKME